MPSKMTSITKEIWTAIEQDVVVRRALEKEIVSQKNLAVHLIKKHKLNTSSDAVVSAIRRYKEERPLEKKYETARKVVSESLDVRITSNIVSIAVEKSKEIQLVLPKIFNVINYEKGEILLIIQGEQAIKLMMNEKNKAKVLDILPKKSVINIEENIAEINIKLTDEAVETPGIISLLSTELMMHDINILELMSCVPEMLFFVKQKDVVKSYEILFGLCRGK